MVLVYGDEKEHYEAFLKQASKADLRRFADPGLQYGAVQAEIEDWRNESFTDERKRASGLGVNLFNLLRHPRTGRRPVAAILPI